MKLLDLLLIMVLVGACHAADVDTMEKKSIKDIKEEHEARLMAMPGVVSVGLGLDDAGSPAVIIGIESEGYADTLILPRELYNYPVKFMVMGSIKAQKPP